MYVNKFELYNVDMVLVASSIRFDATTGLK